MHSKPKTLRLYDLPSVGAAFEGGTFVGITTHQDGTHCAVVLLPDQSPRLTWEAATKWAEQLGAQLPNRPVAAQIFANAKDKLRPYWHWTSEAFHASYAWVCLFNSGHQFISHMSDEGCAVAVRLLTIASRASVEKCQQCQTPASCDGDGLCLEKYIEARIAALKVEG